jgi:hypothetical protein
MHDNENPFLLLNSIAAFIIGLTVLLAMLSRDAVSSVGVAIGVLGLGVGVLGFITLYRRSRRK